MESFTESVLIATVMCGLSTVVGTAEVSGAKRMLFDPPTLQGCQQCYECGCHPGMCVGPMGPPHPPAMDCNQFLHDMNCQAPFHQDGGWGQWASWGPCNGKCGDLAVRERLRVCDSPVPQNCGRGCQGNYYELDTTCTPLYCSITVIASQTLSTSTESTTSTSLKTNVPIVSSTLSTSTVFLTCDKFCAVDAVSKGQQVTDPNSRFCPDNTQQSSEALVALCCGFVSSRHLAIGPNVMANCDSIPRYSPVASFSQGKLQTGSEGIFVNCLQHPQYGIEIIHQDCTKLPELIDVNSTQSILPNPSTYFVIISTA